MRIKKAGNKNKQKRMFINFSCSSSTKQRTKQRQGHYTKPRDDESEKSLFHVASTAPAVVFVVEIGIREY